MLSLTIIKHYQSIIHYSVVVNHGLMVNGHFNAIIAINGHSGGLTLFFIQN